jgi:hypothetical protein
MCEFDTSKHTDARAHTLQTELVDLNKRLLDVDLDVK